MSEVNADALKKLHAELPHKWRVQSFNKKGKATLVAYIDARQVMDLLDEVVGAGNWTRGHAEIKGNIYGCVSIKVGDTWVQKWDVGTESATEGEKGESSDSFKRAAVNWGIGRFLYDMDFIYVKAVEANGKWHVVNDNNERVWDITKFANDLIKKKSKTSTAAAPAPAKEKAPAVKEEKKEDKKETKAPAAAAKAKTEKAPTEDKPEKGMIFDEADEAKKFLDDRNLYTKEEAIDILDEMSAALNANDVETTGLIISLVKADAVIRQKVSEKSLYTDEDRDKILTAARKYFGTKNLEKLEGIKEMAIKDWQKRRDAKKEKK